MSRPNQDKLFVWAATLVYFATWTTVVSALFEWKLLAPALILAAVYAGMQYYEMTVRKHIAFSADATALPAVFAAAASGALAAHYVYGVDAALVLSVGFDILKAWLLGHVVMFVLVFIAQQLGLE